MKLTRPVEIDFLKKHRKKCKSISFSGFLFDLAFLCAFVSALTIFLSLSAAKAQTNYEGLPISGVDIEVENSTSQTSFTADQFEAIVRRTVGERFSAVKNREALQELFNSGRVATARIEVLETNASPRTVRLRFVVRRNTVVDRVTINIGESEGDEVTEEELLVRLNLLQPNAVLTQRALEESADIIQTYLRDRGFYKAEVTFSQQPGLRETRNIVTFNVNPNAQARIENFNINIAGFDAREVLDDINLKPGKTFTRAKLNEDLTRIRRALVKEDFLAADLSDPKVTFDAEKNTITIELTGNVGAKVNVEFRRAEIEDREIVEIKDEEIKISERTQRELLPIKREGDLDTSAITEGGRRLRNKFQEDGYFFAQVEAVCAVNPYLPEDANNFRNNTAAACDFVSGATLDGRTVEVIYAVDLNQRLRLTEIRIEGTDKLPVAEVKPALQSQEANALGIIPGLGYGRGYTSRELLAQDRGNIAVLMRELGYRKAKVTVRQGVSPDGENLIITFVVDEGPLSRVSGVDIVGNTRFTDAQLEAELPPLVGRELSRARARTGNDRILNLYAKEGFIEARSTFAIEEDQTTNAQGEEQVRIVYTLENEGEKAFINRIRTFGNVNTKRESILESIPLKPGDVLRADMITEAERNLYSTDAFTQITITNEAVGTKEDGSGVLRDVIITVEEAPTRILGYGGGASTDEGAFGFVDIRHVNLLGRLYPGSARIQASRRQQMVQLSFSNPRFLREKDGKFAPLTFSAQYLRDIGVTRFFRTTIDRGAFGVVQRLDAEGNPIDEFGARTSAPSINRLTLNLETSRTLQKSTRSFLFVRFRYEDVRLLNIRSLLLAPLLQPDSVVRTSGFGAIFSRDTRENCNNRRTLLERIRTGEEGDPCRYNSSDPTKGEYLTVDYQLSSQFFGGNTSFNKVTANYQRYFQIRQLNNTILAGRATVGAGSLFQVRDRDGNGVIDEIDRSLPISERYFAGGSTTLRGFAFEEAGPRRVITPQGQFRNNRGDLVNGNGFLFPFTVPVGGNALAIVNLEARVPLTEVFQIVPFYDGGNVFRRAGEIFKPRVATPNDVANFNLRTLWTNTVGLGIRFKTPIGGSLAIDYGFLLNPPEFIIPQPAPPNTTYRVRQGQLHFRFTQAF